ncbi:MAG: discoidin domain-containing protein, partial [Fibrobacteria bacterium]|nr:discoidin domain-containing protein [Fibrobacteria bacterium]
MKRIIIKGLLIIAGTFILAQSVPTVKIMFLGDSITEGRGFNFRYLLWNRCLDSGFTFIDFVGDSPRGNYLLGYDNDHQSYGGASTFHISPWGSAAIASMKPDIAFIHAGTNDREGLEKSLNAIREMVVNLRAQKPGVYIVLATIPTKGNDYYTAYNNLATELYNGMSTFAIADVKTVWDDKTDTFDTVHPNLKGCMKIADKYWEHLAPVLRWFNPPLEPRVREFPEESFNYAIDTAVTASRSLNGFGPELAFDGDEFTYWTARAHVIDAETLPPAVDWLEVDLGQVTLLEGTAVHWTITARNYGYKIDVRSAEEDLWETVVEKTVATSETAFPFIGNVDYFDKEARYVRLTVTDVNRGNDDWFKFPASVSEFRVFGPEPVNVSRRIKAGANENFIIKVP